MVCQCLHNTPAQRSSAEELLQQLEAVRPQIEVMFGRQQMKVEMARLKIAMMSAFKNKKAEVEEKDRQTENMQLDLRQMQVKVHVLYTPW